MTENYSDIRFQGDEEDDWHECVCGAAYRNRRAALRCCGGKL